MTDECATLVLRDNYLQSQAISMLEARAASDLLEHAHTIRSLEVSGHLDRALEFLPTTEEIDERHKAGRGLTRPELAVLLAYGKIALYSRLIDSDVPEDPYLSNELQRYFPPLIPKRFGRFLQQHRLRREIIATATTNSMVNRMGPTFARRAQEDTGADAATVVRAYAIAREAFDMRATWSDIEALDTQGRSRQLQYEMMYETTRLLRFCTYWLIHRQPGARISNSRSCASAPGLTNSTQLLPRVLSGEDLASFEARREHIVPRKVPDALSKRIASLAALRSGPDLVDIAEQTGCRSRPLPASTSV